MLTTDISFIYENGRMSDCWITLYVSGEMVAQTQVAIADLWEHFRPTTLQDLQLMSDGHVPHSHPWMQAVLDVVAGAASDGREHPDSVRAPVRDAGSAGPSVDQRPLPF